MCCTFKLRDATHHSVRPVTAMDVNWSLHRAVSIGGFARTQMAAGSLEKPEPFVVVDPKTFRSDFARRDKLTMPDLAVTVPFIFDSKRGADAMRPHPRGRRRHPHGHHGRGQAGLLGRSALPDHLYRWGLAARLLHRAAARLRRLLPARLGARPGRAARCLLRSPRHPYIGALIAAAPALDGIRRQVLLLHGEPRRPVNLLPALCAFHGRCPHGADLCPESRPPLRQMAPGWTAT